MRILSIIKYLVDLAASVLMLVLGIRFAFQLFHANENNAFVKWISDVTNPLIAPFAGIFPDHIINNTYVLNTAALLAFLAVAVVGFILVRIIEALQNTLDRTYDRDLVRNGRIITPRRRTSDRPDAHLIP